MKEHLNYTMANKELIENKRKMKEAQNETNRRIIESYQKEVLRIVGFF